VGGAGTAGTAVKNAGQKVGDMAKQASDQAKDFASSAAQ